MTFKIEKNIPLTSPTIKYPFGDLEVGDSFFCDDFHVKNAAHSYARGRDMTVAVRKENDGFRVWRTK